MISSIPILDDNVTYYFMLPERATLYGSDSSPRRLLRVTDPVPGNSGRMYFSYTPSPDNPLDTYSIESVDIKTFLEFISYGYTPYLEVALCGLGDVSAFNKIEDDILTQAALRNYEQRVKTLLELCDKKKYSLNRFRGGNTTDELANEIWGTLLMWEMLMNTGTIKAYDCLAYMPIKEASIPYKKIRSKQAELQERMLMNNFANMKYKMADGDRQRLMRAFGN